MERKPFQEHTLIKIAGRNVGLIGLDEALERVRLAGPSDRAEAERLLLAEVGRRNYIAPGAEADYRQALWAEYQRLLGRPVEEASGAAPRLTLCGVGCPACERLERDLMAVLSEEGLAAEVEHVRDPAQIVSLGVLTVPALLIDGQPVRGAAASLSKAKLQELVRGLKARGR